eukprot:scaffold395_cov243-Pinguiococcus_pyrenoidosus.AAC.21
MRIICHLRSMVSFWISCFTAVCGRASASSTFTYISSTFASSGRSILLPVPSDMARPLACARAPHKCQAGGEPWCRARTPGRQRLKRQADPLRRSCSSQTARIKIARRTPLGGTVEAGRSRQRAGACEAVDGDNEWVSVVSFLGESGGAGKYDLTLTPQACCGAPEEAFEIWPLFKAYNGLRTPTF